MKSYPVFHFSFPYKETLNLCNERTWFCNLKSSLLKEIKDVELHFLDLDRLLSVTMLLSTAVVQAHLCLVSKLLSHSHWAVKKFTVILYE